MERPAGSGNASLSCRLGAPPVAGSLGLCLRVCCGWARRSPRPCGGGPWRFRCGGVVACALRVAWLPRGSEGTHRGPSSARATRLRAFDCPGVCSGPAGGPRYIPSDRPPLPTAARWHRPSQTPRWPAPGLRGPDVRQEMPLPCRNGHRYGGSAAYGRWSEGMSGAPPAGLERTPGCLTSGTRAARAEDGVPGVPSDPPPTRRRRTGANPHVFRFGMACPDQGVGSPQPWGAELFKR
ncbi:hypothetical protein Spla01_02649 [Streptomyces platensis]|uniref:Uncharacterized protein n=1 Tax=Streptomyces platensis TaxID=58346 RepID=A0ABX3XWG9_STRPT|nr:hypothetical protein BG653_03371 [Streptomyces platensis]